MDSSAEASRIINDRSRKLSKAEARLKAIDDELERYANFSRVDFTVFCSERGLTRNDPNIFEPIGEIVSDYWLKNKEVFPIIYGAIKPILQAATSSSAIERLFSRVSAFVTKQKNCFKSKNLLALLHIAEMDDFQRVSADAFRENGIKYEIENETASDNNADLDTIPESGMASNSTETNDFVSDLLNFDF